MASTRLRIGLGLALVLSAAPVHALDVVLDYRYDESGFFADPERRAVLEHAVRQFTRAIDAELGELPEGEWAAVFPDPGRADRVIYRDLAVERSTLRIFVGAWPRGSVDPARGVPGYAAWRCDDPLAPDACAARAAQDPRALQRAWLERFVFRSTPAAAAWPPRAFAPWGGALSFASDVDWHVGIRGPVSPGKLDLLSIAIRELGRIFGVGTAGSWGTRTARGCFEGARVHAEVGTCPPLAEGGLQLAGSLQPAAFAPGLAVGERRLLTALDEAVLQDLGWERSRQEDEGSALAVIKGDLDGDARVDGRDLILLESSAVLTQEQQWAGDVAPMSDREAMGDGRLDEADVAVLRAALQQGDVDGDGIPTVIENALNAAGLGVGSLLYHPLQRWPDACATAFVGVVPFFGPMSRPVPFCGRDGGPWFHLPWATLFRSPDRAFPMGLDSSPAGQEASQPSADRLVLSMWIVMRAWSPRPDVSPELYLELVGANERAALLASPAPTSPSVDSTTTMAPSTRPAHAQVISREPLPVPEPETVSNGSIEIPVWEMTERIEPETTEDPVPLPLPGRSRESEPEIQWRVFPAPVPEVGIATAEASAPPRVQALMPEGPAPRRDLIRELLDALAELWAQLKAALALA